jgi:hypothetical protein
MLPFYEDLLNNFERIHDDFIATFKGLPLEALDWIPGEDMNTFCVLVVHTTGSERYWVGDVGCAIDSIGRNRDAEFAAKGVSEADLIQRFHDNQVYMRRVFEQMTMGDLDKMNRSPLHDKDFRASWAIQHALDHTALHLGHAQITRQLWDRR